MWPLSLPNEGWPSSLVARDRFGDTIVKRGGIISAEIGVHANISRHNPAALTRFGFTRGMGFALQARSQISLTCHSSNTSEHYGFILTLFDDPERLEARGH